MNPTMPMPDAVQWSEGMLLSPQHLQQNHIYWQAQLRHRLCCITPYFWGVRRLEVNRASLVTGCVSVEALECVLPDGELVEYPGSGPARTLALNVEQLCGMNQRAVRVYVVVREHGAASAMIDNSERRYDCIYSEQAYDENTTDDGLPVYRLRLRYELAAYDVAVQPPANLCACPLLDVGRDGHGKLEIRPYHPPMIRLDAGAFQGAGSLQTKLDELTQKMWLKVDELSGGTDEKATQGEPMSGAGNAQLHAARVLAATLPLLEISVRDPSLHPSELYRVLATVVGQLATLGANPTPLKMTPYLHEDCIAQFSLACRYIDDKLQSLHTDYERYCFTPFKEGFSRRLFEEMHDDVIVELKGRPGQSLTDMGNWLSASNIASADMLHTVQVQRQNGASVRLLSAHEAGKRNLPVDAALFIIKNERIHSKGKNSFQAGAPLMIQGIDRANMPTQIFLYRDKRRTLHPAPLPVDAPTVGQEQESPHV